jgi:hypothetical protein
LAEDKMAKTAVGLFKDERAASAAVKALEAAGVAGKDIRVIGEPLDLPVSGALSIPRVDFEVTLARDLAAMGASKAHVAGYAEGVRKGEFLVLATAAGDKGDAAVASMNAHGATSVEEVAGDSGGLHEGEEEAPAVRSAGDQVLAGRTISRASGAKLFVW